MQVQVQVDDRPTDRPTAIEVDIYKLLLLRHRHNLIIIIIVRPF